MLLNLACFYQVGGLSFHDQDISVYIMSAVLR